MHLSLTVWGIVLSCVAFVAIASACTWFVCLPMFD